MTEDTKTAPDISAENVARMLDGVTPAPLVYGIANARFIAWAREAVPAMAEALKAAEAEIENLRNALRRALSLRPKATRINLDDGPLELSVALKALGLKEASDE